MATKFNIWEGIYRSFQEAEKNAAVWQATIELKRGIEMMISSFTAYTIN